MVNVESIIALYDINEGTMGGSELEALSFADYFDDKSPSEVKLGYNNNNKTESRAMIRSCLSSNH